MNKSKIQIHPEGKIDIHSRTQKYRKALDRLKEDKVINTENKNLILDFIHDCALGKTILGKCKKKIGPSRCLKYLGILRQISDAFGTSFNQVNQKDMETYIQDLENDKYKTYFGSPYSEATKADIKKAIKKFWKWKDGNNKVYPELVEWIDTYVSVKEIPALNRDEVDRMIEYARNPRDKAIIAVLFDSGARVEEILNVRLKSDHLFWKENIGCFMIRLEFSKTKPRTISLPLSTKYIKDWLKMHPAKGNPQAQLFPMTYPSLKMMIKRLGAKTLNRRVTPHMMRHSSATFYANKLKNPFKLCYRYGWTMASKEVNRYLDREGILEEETSELVKGDEISRANKEKMEMSEELSIVKESYSELEEKFENLNKELGNIQNGKGFMKLIFDLAKKQKQMSEVIQQMLGKKFDIIRPSGFGA